MLAQEILTRADVDALIANSSVIECPCCGALNAYSWLDATVDPNTGDLDQGQTIAVHHIPTCGSWEWQCGKCKTPFAERDAPILAECYTHVAIIEG